MKRTIVGLAIAAALLAAAPATADTANGFTVTTTGLNQYNKLHLGSCFTITYTNNRYAYVGRDDTLVGGDGTYHNYPWPTVNAPDQATVTLCPTTTGHMVETLTGVNPIVPGSGDRGDTGKYNLDVWVVQ